MMTEKKACQKKKMGRAYRIFGQTTYGPGESTSECGLEGDWKGTGRGDKRKN
jgi:hypothetical protein